MQKSKSPDSARSSNGFDTGQALDAAAPQLNKRIIDADAAIEAGDLKRATAALRDVGAVVFHIAPFAWDDLPENWGELLGAWLAGHPSAPSTDFVFKDSSTRPAAVQDIRHQTT